MADDDLASKLIRLQEKLEGDRVNWESHWQEVGDLVLPRQAEFTTSRIPGTKRTQDIFDATAVLDLERFAAAMESMLTPRIQRWHTLTATDPVLNEIPEVREYFDEVTRRLFAARNRSNFASQKHEEYMALGAFGTGAMFIEDIPGGNIQYKSIHLGELFMAENQYGRIDVVHRRFMWSANKAFQKWGDALPEKIIETAKTDPTKDFEFLHVVAPNDDIQFGRRDFRGMPFASTYVSYTEKKVISMGGFRTFPYAVSRYVTAPGEVYGRSPAMAVLPDIKSLQEMSKTTLQSAHLAVAPAYLVADDGVLGPLRVRPNAVNRGGVSPDGRPLVHVLPTGKVELGLEMMEQKRRVIHEAFLVTLFQILVETPQMTATEVLERAREKGALLAPAVGRQQSESLGPQIEREIDIMNVAGQLPPMPQVLVDAEGSYEIVYDSPLTRAQAAEESLSLLRTLEAVGPMLSVSPDPARVLRRIDMDAALKGVAHNQGMPQKWMRTDEQLEAMDEQEAQEMQAQRLLEAAPVASETVKTIAEAQAISGAGRPGGV